MVVTFKTLPPALVNETPLTTIIPSTQYYTKEYRLCDNTKTNQTNITCRLLHAVRKIQESTDNLIFLIVSLKTV